MEGVHLQAVFDVVQRAIDGDLEVLPRSLCRTFKLGSGEPPRQMFHCERRSAGVVTLSLILTNRERINKEGARNRYFLHKVQRSCRCGQEGIIVGFDVQPVRQGHDHCAGCSGISGESFS